MANTIIVAGAAAATLVILAYGVTHRSLRVSDPAGAVAIGLFVAFLGVLGFLVASQIAASLWPLLGSASWRWAV